MNDRTTTSPPATGPARFRAREPQQRRNPLVAVGAAIALLLLAVGVPIGLVRLAGPPPVPTSLPTRADLTQPVGVDTLITVLVAVVWIAWALFVVSVVVEVVSALRGGGLPRHVPLAGPVQTLARLLVSALLLGGVVVGPAATAVTGPFGGTVGGAAPAGLSASAVVDERATADDRPGDDLFASVAHATPAAPAAGDNDLVGKKVYVVNAPRDGYHDNLWDIADRHLGDGRRYKEIFQLNEGRLQPDGRSLELARLIQPGWNLVMPEDATGVQRVRAPEPGERGGPGPAGADQQADGRAGGQDQGAPAYAAADTADGTAGDTTLDDSGSTATGSPSVVGSLTGSGLLCAGIIGSLVLYRRRRRGADPDADAAETEVRLRVAATPDRADWFSSALRELGTACLAARTPPPSAYAAVLDDDSVELLLAPPREDAVGAWESVDGGRRWRRGRPDSPGSDGGFSPYPAMVSLGVDEAGRDVLVDLEAAGGPVAVEGDSVVAAEVAAGIAVQLATNAWSGDLRVTASQIPGAVRGIGEDRIRVVDDLATVLPEFEQLRQDFTTDVLHGRMARRPGVVPQFVVCGAQPEPSVADRLNALTGASRQAFGLVYAGPSAAARWHLRVDEAGVLSMPLMDISVVANRLSRTEVEHVAALFAGPRGDESADSGDRPHIPQPARDVDDAAWTTADVRVGILGPSEVRAPGTLAPERRGLVTEIVTFLALHPGGVHPNVLAGSVWPKGVTDEVRDSNIERAREWLGVDGGGDYHLQQDGTGRLLLGPGVVVDWDCLCALLRRARVAATVGAERDLLWRALRLVRGPLLEAREKQRYSWLARTHLERTVPDVVIDAAHRLAEITRDSDPGAASSAAEAGLRLQPTSLLLWRDLLSAQYAVEGVAGAQRVLHVMGADLDACGVRTDPETEALIEELVPGPTSLPRAGG